MAVPKYYLGGIESREGARIGFNLGLNDDDDAGDRDSYLVWLGRSTLIGAEHSAKSSWKAHPQM